MTTRKQLTINDSYQIGDLSYFPVELDQDDSLYNAGNNAIAILTGRISVQSKILYVNNTAFFPDEGIIRVNSELIHYKNKEGNSFYNLTRGFNSSSIGNHNTGSLVLGCVASLHHNSVRDAIIQCEGKTGVISDLPDINGTLTSRLRFLDIKWFTPTSRFFAFPRTGHFPLTVNFKNMSLGDPYGNIYKDNVASTNFDLKAETTYVWDFGDGSDSPEKYSRNPVHVYETPGMYTVSLTLISNESVRSSLGKHQYVKVFDYNAVTEPLAYARIPAGNQENSYKILKLNDFGRPKDSLLVPFTVEFVDQTSGVISTRKWNFGDGESAVVDGYANHTCQHTYTQPGIYWPELFILDSSGFSYQYRFRQPIVIGIAYSVSVTERLLQNFQAENSLLKPQTSKLGVSQKILDDINMSVIIG